MKIQILHVAQIKEIIANVAPAKYFSESNMVFWLDYFFVGILTIVINSFSSNNWEGIIINIYRLLSKIHFRIISF